MSLRAQHWLIVGLGASGTSALRYLLREGAVCLATDSRDLPPDLAALRAEFPQVGFHVGGFFAPEPLNRFAGAIVSPGVSLDDEFVQKLAAAGVPILGDVELFARALSRDPGPGSRLPAVIAITGSNGKSTVTTLVGNMVRAAGLNVKVGGNLGKPVLDLLDASADLYVLELSSFQLETTHSLRSTAATVLNLSEDHLDRHHTMENYGRIKSGIYRGADVAVVNRDDVATSRNTEQASAVLSFGLDLPSDGHYGLLHADGQIWLMRGAQRLLAMSELRMIGLHNAANALAALALGEVAGIALAPALQALVLAPAPVLVLVLVLVLAMVLALAPARVGVAKAQLPVSVPAIPYQQSTTWPTAQSHPWTYSVGAVCSCSCTIIVRTCTMYPIPKSAY